MKHAKYEVKFTFHENDDVWSDLDDREKAALSDVVRRGCANKMAAAVRRFLLTHDLPATAHTVRFDADCFDEPEEACTYCGRTLPEFEGDVCGGCDREKDDAAYIERLTIEGKIGG